MGSDAESNPAVTMDLEEAKRRILLWAPDNPRFQERISRMDSMASVLSLARQTYGNDVILAVTGGGFTDDDIRMFRPAGPEAPETAKDKADAAAAAPEGAVTEGPALPPAGSDVDTDAETEMVRGDSSVDSLIDQVADAIDSITDADLAAAYEATSLYEAVATVVKVLADKNVPLEDREIVNELFPDEMKKGAASNVFGGLTDDDKLTGKQDFLRMFYDGDFSDQHDWLIDSGFKVKFQMNADGDLDIYYIEPESNRARDINGLDVGEFDAMTKEIEFLSNQPDSRKPIGVDTGAYDAEGTGVNTVVAKPTFSLQEFYDSFGATLQQQVTGKTWEDVLEQDLSLSSGMRDLIMRGVFPLQEEFIDIETSVSVQRTFEYLEGDNLNLLIDMPVEDIGALQQRYAAMGPHVYQMGTPGLIDPRLANAVNLTMAAGNDNYAGISNGFEQSLADFEASKGYQYNWFGGRPTGRSGGGGGTSRVWRPPAYLAPDYAEISQAVKATFEQKLGRAPSDAEVSVLSTKMKSDHRGEFDAQATAQKMQFFSSGGTSAGTVQDVNYAARFQEDFADKYTNELGTLDRLEMSRNMTQSALGSILSADRAIGY